MSELDADNLETLKVTELQAELKKRNLDTKVFLSPMMQN
jgi:hypothetical protein